MSYKHCNREELFTAALLALGFPDRNRVDVNWMKYRIAARQWFKDAGVEFEVVVSEEFINWICDEKLKLYSRHRKWRPS